MGNINKYKKLYEDKNELNGGTTDWRNHLIELGFSGGSIVDDTKAMLIANGFWLGSVSDSLRLYFETEYPENRNYYDLDAIDDYISIPTISLEAGCVISFEFFANTKRTDRSHKVINSTDNNFSSSCVINFSGGALKWSAFKCTMMLDGVPVSNGDLYVADGLPHKMVLTFTEVSGVELLGTIEHNHSGAGDSTSWYEGSIFNVVVRAGSDVRNYPINEGVGATEIKDIVGGKHGTPMNFDDGRWFIDTL